MARFAVGADGWCAGAARDPFKTEPGPCFDWPRFRREPQKNAAPAHPGLSPSQPKTPHKSSFFSGFLRHKKLDLDHSDHYN